MKLLTVIFASLATLTVLSAENDSRAAVQVILHPDKNEYAAAVPGSDKHKYGYELKENKYFHHTTTEEDGVRLGCYGHVLDGKKYSTQYVADSRGYRPVYTYDPITVYPKNGPERKASFVGEFSESEEQSLNIRYFFPDGCKGFDFKQQPSINTPVIVKKPDPPIRPPITTTPKPVTPVREPSTSNPNFLRPKVEPPAPVRNPPTPRPTPPTPRPTPPTPKTPATAPPVVKPTPRSQLTPPADNTCKADSCCDDHKPKLVIPIQLKGKSGETGSCGTYGKLTVPVEGLDADLLRSLTNGGDSKALIRSILQNIE